MRALLSTVSAAAIVGGLVVGAVAPATAAANAHRPGKISLSSSSVAEDAARGTLVGKLSSYDPDSGFRHTFSFVAGKGDDDNSLFAIRGTRLVTAGALDYEKDPELSVRLRVTDKTGRWREGRFDIDVRDVADQPPTDLTLSGSSVDENQPVGTVVGTLATVDSNHPPRTYSYKILGGGNAGAFAISGDQLVTAASLDHEAAATRTVRVQAFAASGDSVEKDFAIAVGDVNEAPANIAVSPASVDEGVVNAVVGTLSAVDPDAGDAVTFAFATGAGDTDNSSFTIDGTTLRTAIPLDFETKSAYSILVTATDRGGLSATQALTVTANDVSEGPSNLRLTNDNFDENALNGTVVGNAIADGAVSYSLVDPCSSLRRGCRVPAGGFTISSSGVLKTRYSEYLDYEESSHSFPITIKATDNAGHSIQKAFTIHLNDVNEAPVDISLIDQTSVQVSDGWNRIGDLMAVDQDADDEVSFQVLAAEDSDGHPVADGVFDIGGCGSPELWADTDELDVDTYTVTIRATDLGGLFYDEDFDVSVVAPGPPVAPHRIVAARRC